MEKQLHQERGDKIRKPLPEIPKKYWDMFTAYADEEWNGDWGLAFKALVQEYLTEPEFLPYFADHEERITKLEESNNDIDKEPIAVMCDGEEVKEIE